jgi:hypothetical protein
MKLDGGGGVAERGAGAGARDGDGAAVPCFLKLM